MFAGLAAILNPEAMKPKSKTWDLLPLGFRAWGSWFRAESSGLGFGSDA